MRRPPPRLLLLLLAGRAGAQTLLNDGERLVVTTLPFTWNWFELPLELSTTDDLYNAHVEVDAESLVDAGGDFEWARFDVLILNGTIPGNAQTGMPGPVSIGNPYCWINEACDAYHFTYQEKSRVTAAIGYNYTAIGGMREPAMTNLIVGVREAGGAGGLVVFSVRATRLSHSLPENQHLDISLPPCDEENEETCRIYFTVPLGSYDILKAHLTRTGNVTHPAGSPNAGESNGQGFVGDLYLGMPTTVIYPPPLEYGQHYPVKNSTTSAEIGYFCTTEKLIGFYTVAIVAGTEDGGFAPELMTTPQELALGEPVTRPGRGRFMLHVRHAAYEDGLIESTPDARHGCLDFGQTRTYELQSSSNHDNNLYVAIAQGNVSSLRARCDGCAWVEATPPISAVSMSPCAMRNGTKWWVEVSLLDEQTATLAGTPATEFLMSTMLENATTEHGKTILPRSEGAGYSAHTLGGGAEGYVCCGGIKSWLVPDVPETHAVAVVLNVTRGVVRTLFLKHDQCVIPTVDVDDSVCRGTCELVWMTVYDEFYGNMQHTYSQFLQIPFGPEPWIYEPELTKRRRGDGKNLGLHG